MFRLQSLVDESLFGIWKTSREKKRMGQIPRAMVKIWASTGSGGFEATGVHGAGQQVAGKL